MTRRSLARSAHLCAFPVEWAGGAIDMGEIAPYHPPNYGIGRRTEGETNDGQPGKA